MRPRSILYHNARECEISTTGCSRGQGRKRDPVPTVEGLAGASRQARQPDSIASTIASSGRSCTTPEASSRCAAPARSRSYARVGWPPGIASGDPQAVPDILLSVGWCAHRRHPAGYCWPGSHPGRRSRWNRRGNHRAGGRQGDVRRRQRALPRAHADASWPHLGGQVFRRHGHPFAAA